MNAAGQEMKRILFVDDDYTDQRLMEILMLKKGVTVDECMTPTAAPILINKNGYDAIIIDYRLPILNGIELIKKFQDKIHCPIYIISAHDIDFIKGEIEKHGVKVSGVISKNGLRKNLDDVFDTLYGPTQR